VRTLSSAKKQSERVYHHLLLSSAKVKNAGGFASTFHGAVLLLHVCYLTSCLNTMPIC
jgi:hypothetical protein